MIDYVNLLEEPAEEPAMSYFCSCVADSPKQVEVQMGELPNQQQQANCQEESSEETTNPLQLMVAKWNS